jgi:altronate hydrolase
VTTQPVAPGQWVHSHNLANDDLDLDYAPATEVPAPPQPLAGKVFQGYRRSSGRVGTRNYLAVISMVNCSASVSKYVARRFDASALEPIFQTSTG